MTQFFVEVLLTLVLLALATAAIWLLLYLIVWRFWFAASTGESPAEVSRSRAISVFITLLFAMVVGTGWAAAVDMWFDPITTKPGAVFVGTASTLWV